MCVPGNTANSAAASALETPALTGVSPFNGRRKTPPDPICFSKTYGLHLEYCSNRIIAAAVGFLSYRLNVPTADDDVAEHDPRLLDASGATVQTPSQAGTAHRPASARGRPDDPLTMIFRWPEVGRIQPYRFPAPSHPG